MNDHVLESPSRLADSKRRTVERYHPDYSIGDKQFMDDVAQLKALRSYMIRQAKIAQAGTIELGQLNLLYFHEAGRLPTYDEWTTLEDRSSELYQHLTEADRRRFLYGQIPRFVIKTASSLGVLALMSLVGAVATTLFFGLGAVNVSLTSFMAFLLWAAALGGIGSIAFIGMNALAVQEDATFDITNEKLIALRVVLGALFAVVITLPFGFEAFKNFILGLFTRDSTTSSALALKSVLLLLPFILGFSTTLVIMVLNQFIEAVQMFFGKRNSPAATATTPGQVPQPVVQPPAGQAQH